MVLRMARPWKHPDSGIYYVRGRIPRDVLARARGRQLVFPAEAGGGSVVIRTKNDLVKASLRTREPYLAKERHAAALAYMERLWRALRAGPRPLTKKQIVALAGRVYRAFAAGAEDDPGSPAAWAKVLRFNEQASKGVYGLTSLRIYKNKGQRRAASMEERYGGFADHLLNAEAIVADAASRAALIEELHRALSEAAEKLKRNAEGDYRPDTNAARFPEWKREGVAQTAGSVSLTALFEDWSIEARARNRTEKTINEYRAIIRRFVAFVGHDDASRMTDDDVLRWKNARLAAGIAAKTVAHSDLACLKSVFKWAKANKRINSNPTAEISFAPGRKTKERSQGFTDEEATAILRRAATYTAAPREHPQTAAAKRWVPWLCAYTGARVGEMVQLRKQDIRREQGHWVAIVTPEAGTVKNKRMREVVLHPHLIESGFADFVASSKGQYLFLNASNRREARGRAQALKNRLAEFARAVVPDRRVSPNHGWRHRFKTVGTEVGIATRVLDGICGHAPSTVGEAYGDVTLRAQATALAKLPRYEIKGSKNAIHHEKRVA